MYIIGAFSNGVCYDLQSLGYNIGHVLSVVHGPFYGLLLNFVVLASVKRKKNIIKEKA